MKRNSEKSIEKELKRRIESKGGLCLKFWCLSMVGFPDRICLIAPGRVFFAELKSEGQKPTPVQLAVHGMLRRMGFVVAVIDTWDKLDMFTETIINDL